MNDRAQQQDDGLQEELDKLEVDLVMVRTLANLPDSEGNLEKDQQRYGSGDPVIVARIAAARRSLCDLYELREYIRSLERHEEKQDTWELNKRIGKYYQSVLAAGRVAQQKKIQRGKFNEEQIELAIRADPESWRLSVDKLAEEFEARQQYSVDDPAHIKTYKDENLSFNRLKKIINTVRQRIRKEPRHQL